jgi:hypothetical protein
MDVPARTLFRQSRDQHPNQMTECVTFKKPQRTGQGFNSLNF